MISSYCWVLMHGALTTLILWFSSATISLCIGFIGGIVACDQWRYTSAQRIIAAYVFLARGIPAYVQLLLMYFVIPSMLHINISPLLAAIIALGFCSAGYVIEIIRSGINAVPRGQWEAAAVLGYSTTACMYFIILPQALRTILPALIGEHEQLLKSTALAATIGVLETTRTGINIVSREFNPIPVYLTIAFIYLIFSAVFTFFSSRINRRLQYVTY